MAQTEASSESNKEKILKKKGKFVVKACPGSGKTSTVAAKIDFELKNWNDSNQGIAAISFTNVAWQEIESKLLRDFKITFGLNYPHFLGTIDSFVNKLIFLPFGHLVINCDKRPEIITNWEPEIRGHFQCKKYACNLKDISYNINGELISYNNNNSHFSKCNLNNSFCDKAKKMLQKKGYVTQSDANYFAMKILKEYPNVAKAITYRFPILFVDEAQDTSEIQMKILETLVERGLQTIMLVGDPNQAIYEWRAANPDVFLKKKNEWDTILLNENWRSSKKICKFTDKLLSEEGGSISVNDKVKDFDFEPQIWGYNKSSNLEINRLIQKFIIICESNKIDTNKESIAVLVRAKSILNQIRGQEFINHEPWKETQQQNGKTITDTNRDHYKNIAKSKYLFDKKEYKDAFKVLERTVCSLKLKKSYISNEELKDYIKQIGAKEWRREIFNILIYLPETNLILKDWVERANEVIKNSNFLNIPNFEVKIKQNRGDSRYSEMKFEQIFDTLDREEENYTLGTVHSVKGRTFEAVLLIVKERGSHEKYSNILDQKIENNEEKRIIYVASTRPSKILVIAVPEIDKIIWTNKFFKNANYNKSLIDFS